MCTFNIFIQNFTLGAGNISLDVVQNLTCKQYIELCYNISQLPAHRLQSLELTVHILFY